MDAKLSIHLQLYHRTDMLLWDSGEAWGKSPRTDCKFADKRGSVLQAGLSR